MKMPPETTMIRSFGLFVGLVCLAVAGYGMFRAQAFRPNPILTAVGAYFLLGAVVYQPMLRPVFRGLMKLAGALGWFNTRLLLGLMYYLMFTPFSLVQRLIGRDALRLARQADASLWTPKPQPVGGKSSYFRQF
jgi:hypothetical protein